ncbi:3-oxoadipyl-CoA thiolase [Rhizobiales bacterium]|uniref:3-oxoadipyl-CoA thiolase n=1 Tax=Hongsoonwoonella zoysiae TaxID=2821844 RepID=UPI0015608E57|nr:3-oxoadipyl-CoA thiolase [Hongsoonwoonella zoysiae]NRG16211.1 3-oxoadipyl-CoA thiolase [Hongsoonwoonella zoysiae]
MRDVYICDYVRTPIGRYGGALSAVRTDDLAAVPLRALSERNTALDLEAVDEVIFGCANQAGEDNRNVARMAVLIAGFPETVPAITVNRLCASGMDAVIVAARSIQCGAQELVIAGGVESMSRAPFVVPKATDAFTRNIAIEDTTIGWRFVNPAIAETFGVDTMPETAENVAEDFRISRDDQDLFAFNSQRKTAEAQASGRFVKEIVSVNVTRRRGEQVEVTQDEHPRPETTVEKLNALRAPFRKDGSVTAGNSSGVNDGAAALILASEEAVHRHNLTPIARVVMGASAGLAPRIMGYGPVPAIEKLLDITGITLQDVGVIEVNEAFASQVLATLRGLDIHDDDPRVNPNGGAIALGHPLGMSGVRITGSAALDLKSRGDDWAVAAMCVGVGQGTAILLGSM